MSIGKLAIADLLYIRHLSTPPAIEPEIVENREDRVTGTVVIESHDKLNTQVNSSSRGAPCSNANSLPWRETAAKKREISGLGNRCSKPHNRRPYLDRENSRVVSEDQGRMIKQCAKQLRRAAKRMLSSAKQGYNGP
jgi:hypothetical protein